MYFFIDKKSLFCYLKLIKVCQNCFKKNISLNSNYQVCNIKRIWALDLNFGAFEFVPR